MEITRFEAWDTVRYIESKAGTIYTIESLTDTWWLILKWYSGTPFNSKYFYHVNKQPITNQQTTMTSVNYFHTSVLVRDRATETSTNIEYKELVPYSVRQALSYNDMRDTLVRELPKEVATTDCKFNIKAIFD